MLEVTGNIWNFHSQGEWIGITTNGTIKKNKELVMGKGIALEAATKFPEVPKLLGVMVHKWGNIPYILRDYKMISFPTKHHWRNFSDIDLIIKSAELTMKIFTDIHVNQSVKRLYMPRPGCGNGGLPWNLVKPILESIFTTDRIIIISMPS